MTKSSIFYSITFIFSISIISIFLALLFLLEYDKQQYTEKLNAKYSIIARATLFHLNNFITNDELKKQVQGYQMREIADTKVREEIVKSAQIIQKITDKIGTSAILKFENDHYLYIETKYSSLLLKDEDYQPYRYDLIKIIFGVVFVIIIIAYVLTLRKLKPLRTLKRQMDRFAKGDLEIDCKTDGEDEIAQVSNAFHNAVAQINKLNQSRQLFLRNIMHELKTPITKGRISAEMLENATYQSILQNVFSRQEALLEEFSRIEKLSADELKLDIQTYRIDDVVDFALDILEDKKEYITCNLTPISLHVDFELFGVVLKNLLDNGLNYAMDNHVTLSNDTKSITISNQGVALEFPLERYGEPYFLEGKKQKTSRGLGFGLFIVWHIVRLHGMEISYQREGDYNHFIITL